MSRVSHCQVKAFFLEKPGFVFQSAGKKCQDTIPPQKNEKIIYDEGTDQRSW